MFVAEMATLNNPLCAWVGVLEDELLNYTLGFSSISTVGAASATSRAFASAGYSESVWEKLCERRWRTKERRFHLTEARRAELLEDPGATGATWRDRYRYFENDGFRTFFRSPVELAALTFDCRFRAHPDAPASLNFKFNLERDGEAELHPREVTEGDASLVGVAAGVGAEALARSLEEPTTPMAILGGGKSGRVSGHPNGLTYRWELIDRGKTVTLGLFPPARASRLPNWGWALSNPNIVLVSRDPTDESGVAEERLVADHPQLFKSADRARGYSLTVQALMAMHPLSHPLPGEPMDTEDFFSFIPHPPTAAATPSAMTPHPPDEQEPPRPDGH